jgi:hypothetical protein
MTDWFRSWHGAPTDPKWLGIAKRAGVAPGLVVAVAWALMDRASQAKERGSIEGYDAEGLACFFGCEASQVDAIVQAMTDKDMLIGHRFAAWEERQPLREDDSRSRVTAYRERQRNAAKRTVTRCNAPDTDTETDTETSSLRSDVAREGTTSAPMARLEFGHTFWPAYPHKVGRRAAEEAFVRARRKATLTEIMDGLARYKSDKPPDRQWLNPATFLNQERWTDEPAPPAAKPVNGASPGLSPAERALASVERLRRQMGQASGGDSANADRSAGGVELLPPGRGGAHVIAR